MRRKVACGGDIYAKLMHRLQRHADIPLALQRGGGDDNRGPVQQRQGHEQAGKKLAGHIPRQAVLPRRQPAFYSKDAVLLFVPDALFVKYVEIGLLGPLHQPSVTGEDATAPKGKGNGDEEAERRPRFPTVEFWQIDTFCVQFCQAPPGSPDVLGVRQTMNHTPLPRKGGADEQPVGLGFAGGRRDGPGEFSGSNGEIHRAASVKRRRPSRSSRTVSARPTSFSTTTSMLPPSRFLSPVAAA